MKTKHIIVGALLTLITVAAQAASTDLSFGPMSTQVDKFSHTPFTDTYNFSFDGVSGIASGSLIEYKLSRFIDIDWADQKAFTLYGGWDGSGAVLASFVDPGTPTGSFAIEDLPVPNKFSIVVSGQAIGDGSSLFQPGLKGSYNLSVVTQPIPEPGSYALMFEGLAGLGLLLSTRRRATI
jgi:hypothetical protein